MDFDRFFDLLLPNTVGGLTIGAIYALIALGYTMVYGVLRLINFAHGEIFMIGTFVSMMVFSLTGASTAMSTIALIGLILLAAVIAASVTGGAAVLLEAIAYRPLRKRGAERLAALISAIGASLFLQQLFARYILPLDGDSNGATRRDLPERVVPRNNPDGTPLIDDLFGISNFDIRFDQVVIFVAALLMMLLLDQIVNRTRIGRGIRATAQDSEAAVLMGVNIDTVVRTTFFLGGSMAGIAGLLYVIEIESSWFFEGFVLGIKAFTAAVLGGIGNIRGALLGGFVLGLVETWASGLLGSEWKNVTAFVVLVLILLIRPTGILGESLQKARA